MCTDAMAVKWRKQRERRARWFRKRKSVCPGAWKAAVRKRAGKWPRRAGGLAAAAAAHSPAVLEEAERGSQAAAFPSGAMAPRNTTQYLMEVAYSDLNITAPASSERNSLKPKHMYSYTSLDAEEDTLDFESRDLERELYPNEL